MIRKATLRTLAGALILTGWLGAADAQFSGFVNLPQNDFTWRWGDWEDARRKFEDFAVSGGEGGFRCDLVGALRSGSRMSRTDIREIENDLRVSLYFIQSAASTMNILDQQREIDWAELVCLKPQPTQSDAQESQERVDRAREKAVQEMLERRERRERQSP